MVEQLRLRQNRQRLQVIHPAPVGDPSQQEGDKPQPVADGDKPADDKKPENDKQRMKRTAINRQGAPEKHEFQAAEGWQSWIQKR